LAVAAGGAERGAPRPRRGRGGPTSGRHHKAAKGRACDGGRPLAAGLRPSTQRENKLGAGRARHPTECPLCVPGWEGDGVGRAHAVRHDAKKCRARERATQQGPPHVVSHGRIPPVGPLGLLTQGGACRRTHVCEQGLPDERVWRTRLTRPARARPRNKNRLRPPDTCRESGGGPPIRCLARWGTPALARASS